MSLIFRSEVLERIQAGSLGLAAGCVATYFTASLVLFIREHASIEQNWYLIVIAVGVFYGQVQYLEQNLKALTGGIVPTLGWPGRLNAAASASIQRGQFEYYRSLLEQRNPQLVGVDGDPIGHDAYKRVKKYMTSFSLMTLVGIAAGLVLRWYRS